VVNISSTYDTPPRHLPSQLEDKLYEVAARHGGRVPLHGRLFAQWMHFAFPLECPYPQVIERNGALSPTNKPARWAYVTQEDKKAARQSENPSIEQPFMSQWNDDEVLPLEDESMPIGSTLFESRVRSCFQFVILAVMIKMCLSFARSGTLAILRWSSNGAENAMKQRWNRVVKAKASDLEIEQDKDNEKEKNNRIRKQSSQKECRPTQHSKKKPKQPPPPQQHTASPPPSEAEANSPQPTSSRAARRRSDTGGKASPVAAVEAVVLESQKPEPVQEPQVPQPAEEVAAEAVADSNHATATAEPVEADTTSDEGKDELPSPSLSPVRAAAPADAEVPRPSKFLPNHGSNRAPAQAAAKDGPEDVSKGSEPHKILEEPLTVGLQTNTGSADVVKSSKPNPLATLVWLDPAGKSDDANKLQSRESRTQRSKSETCSMEVQGAPKLLAQEEVQQPLASSQSHAQSAWATDEISHMCQEALGCIYPYAFEAGGRSTQVQAPVYGGVQPAVVSSITATGEQKPVPFLQPHQPARGTQPRQQRKALKTVDPRTHEFINSAELFKAAAVRHARHKEMMRQQKEMQELQSAHPEERADVQTTEISQGWPDAMQGWTGIEEAADQASYLSVSPRADDELHVQATLPPWETPFPETFRPPPGLAPPPGLEAPEAPPPGLDLPGQRLSL